MIEYCQAFLRLSVDGLCGKSITSDTIGNMLSDGTWTYTWEHGRELATMSNGSTSWTFAYDASGMPLSVTFNGTKHYYVTNVQGDVTAICKIER